MQCICSIRDGKLYLDEIDVLFNIENKENNKMINKTRKDFSYDLWGDPALAICDGNRAIFEMNPIYGKGTSISLGSDVCIYPTLSEYSINLKQSKSNIPFFKDDAIWLGKILDGKFLIKGKNNLNILLTKGDVFCISGNYTFNEKFHMEEEILIKTIGIFAYYNEIMAVLKKNNWKLSIIKNILNKSDLKVGIKLSKTYGIEKILDDLYISMKDDNRFVAYVKSIELFSSFINIINEEKYKNAKTYNEKQVEIVISIKKFLDENLDKYYSMPKLAEMFNISLSRMQSIFNDYYGFSPYKYHLNKRLEKAHDLIINSDIKITEIARLVGFNSYDKFFLAYKNMYGCNPSKYRM